MCFHVFRCVHVLYMFVYMYVHILASLVAQTVKSPPAMQRPRFHPWVRKIPWRRECQPTPVFLPGEPHGAWGLVGYRPWSHKEGDTTEQLTHTHMCINMCVFMGSLCVCVYTCLCIPSNTAHGVYIHTYKRVHVFYGLSIINN